MANTAYATLVLGTSGSGKSYLAKSMTNLSSLPVYIINGSEKDYDTDKFQHITFDEFQESEEDISNCNLIIDDIVKPSDLECKIIQQILVKNKRHKNVNIYALSHQIERNGLHPFMQHFDFIIFTNSVKNTSVFKVYVKKFCPKDYSECMLRWDDFIQKQSKTTYLRYNNIESQFQLIDVKGSLLLDPQTVLRKEILQYIEPFGEVKKCMAFFDYLVKRLPTGVISPDDLTLTLGNQKGDQLPPICVLDLCVSVPRTNLERPPPKELIHAFKILQKAYKLPFCFIGNDYFM